MAKATPTAQIVADHLAEFGIEFGEKYRDKSSGFEGNAVGLYFFEHGCLRVCLRGQDRQSGGPLESTFDAPELVRVATETPVPASTTKRGGPRGLGGPAGARRG